MMLLSTQNKEDKNERNLRIPFFVCLNPDTKVDFSKIKRYNKTRKCTIFVKYFRIERNKTKQ